MGRRHRLQRSRNASLVSRLTRADRLGTDEAGRGKVRNRMTEEEIDFDSDLAMDLAGAFLDVITTHEFGSRLMTVEDDKRLQNVIVHAAEIAARWVIEVEGN